MARGFDNIYKVFTTQKNNENDDETHFTKNCAVFLRYHKWINCVLEQYKSILSYDSMANVMRSTVGIKVVEIRRDNDEMVLESWVFTSKVLKFQFRIPEEILKQLVGEKTIIVVEDTHGNILRKHLNL